MSLEEVVKKTLVLQVFDWDLITGDDDIGEVRMADKILLTDKQTDHLQVRIPLANIDLKNGTDQWIEIEKLTQEEGKKWTKNDVFSCSRSVENAIICPLCIADVRQKVKEMKIKEVICWSNWQNIIAIVKLPFEDQKEWGQF